MIVNLENFLTSVGADSFSAGAAAVAAAGAGESKGKIVKLVKIGKG